MVITKTYNNKFNCDWFHCTIKNETYSSPHLKQVELWRDDKVINADYHKEMADLHDKAMQYMYDNNPTNYTGD